VKTGRRKPAAADRPAFRELFLQGQDCVTTAIRARALTSRMPG
jgi:hypothetical protein